MGQRQSAAVKMRDKEDFRGTEMKPWESIALALARRIPAANAMITREKLGRTCGVNDTGVRYGLNCT
jgi:hypothetical protein